MALAENFGDGYVIMDAPIQNDELSKNLHKYAVENNPKELEKLLLTAGLSGYKTSSDSLSRLESVLSEVYDELKIKNCVLSDEIEFLFIQKIIDTRFYTQIKEEEVDDASLENTLQRIDTILTFSKKLDDQFRAKELNSLGLFLCQSIAKSVHILKRLLKFTYDKIPWEEMEFCLITFIMVSFKPSQSDEIYKLVLDKQRLLNHLNYFTEELYKVKLTLTKKLLKTKTNFSKRENYIVSLIKNNPHFQDLLHDYEIIKDVYSLKRINFYLLKSLNPSLHLNVEGKLVIERTLQVLGEYLKSTPVSPNLSDDVHKILLYSAPKNLKEIIISIRDTLSHAESLVHKKKLENEGVEYFIQLQKDLKKIHEGIYTALKRRKMSALSVFCQKIDQCEDMDQLTSLLPVVEIIEKGLFENDDFYDVIFEKLKNIKNILDILSELIGEKQEQETVIFQRVNLIISSQKEVRKLSVRDMVSQVKYNQTENLSSYKMMFDIIYKNITSEVHASELNLIQQLVLELREILFERMPCSNIIGEIEYLIEQIVSECQLTTDRMYYVQKFNRTVNPSSNHISLLRNPKMEIESILTDFLLDKLENDEIKTNFNKWFLNISSIASIKADLLSILETKAPGEVSVTVNSVKLPDLLQKLNLKKTIEKKIMTSYENDHATYKRLVSAIDDPYKTLLTNWESYSRFAYQKQTEALQPFLANCKLRNVNFKTFINVFKEQKKNYIKSLIGEKIRALSYFVQSEKDTAKIISVFKSNTNYRIITELLVLDILNILEESSKFNANNFFFDCCSPILLGKPLRNYLAHGNAFVDSLHYDPEIAILANALKLISDNTLIIDNEEIRIGKQSFLVLNEDRILKNYYFITMQTMMFFAIRNCKDFRNYLEVGADIRGRDLNGLNALHFAAAGNNIGAFEYLLNNGLSLTSKDFHGNDPLDLAIAENSSNIIQYYLKNKLWLKNNDFSAVSFLGKVLKFGKTEYVEITVDFLEDDSLSLNKDIGVQILKTAIQDGNESLVLKVLEKQKRFVFENHNFLHLAAASNRINVIKILLQKGVDINSVDKQGLSSLHLASKFGRQEAVELLLAEGANVNYQTKNGNLSALHFAIEGNFSNVVRNLVESGASVNSITTQSRTPLYYCCMFGCLESAEFLVENGADVNLKDNCFNAPLHAASFRGYKGITEVLLNAEADVNSIGSHTYTPIHLACQNGHSDVVRLLKNHSPHILKQIDQNGLNSLHMASAFGHLDIVKIILEEEECLEIESESPSLINDTKKIKKENLDFPDNDGDTALHKACMEGYPEIVEVLLNYGSNINSQNLIGYTPLHLACLKGFLNVVEVLIKRGPDVNIKNKYGNTPMLLSCVGGSVKIVNILLANGASVNLCNDQGLSPIHEACRCNHTKIIPILLDKGADVNIKASDGSTPLHLACQNGNTEIVNYIQQNSDINTHDENGNTALIMASAFGGVEIVRSLLLANVNVSKTNKQGFDALHLASKFGHPDVVQLLVENGGDVNVKAESSGKTALHLACQGGHMEVAETLLNYCADQNILDGNSQSPLDLAIHHCHAEITELLLKNKVNVYCADGTNILQNAVMSENFQIFECVLNYIINESGLKDEVLNGKDEEGETVLMLAVQLDNHEMVRELLSCGTEINAQDFNGMTALHWAAEASNAKLLTMLLENPSIDGNIRDNKLRTALDIIRANCQRKF